MKTCFPGPTDEEINAMFPPPEPDRSTLGGLVKAARRMYHMTQKDLAGYCNVTFKYISDLENGRLTDQPSTDVLESLSFALDLPMEELTDAK